MLADAHAGFANDRRGAVRAVVAKVVAKTVKATARSVTM
jgi:copper oxidase (laccase) domain-containing protein